MLETQDGPGRREDNRGQRWTRRTRAPSDKVSRIKGAAPSSKLRLFQCVSETGVPMMEGQALGKERNTLGLERAMSPEQQVGTLGFDSRLGKGLGQEASFQLRAGDPVGAVQPRAEG